jgi:hypothetical protein
MHSSAIDCQNPQNKNSCSNRVGEDKISLLDSQYLYLHLPRPQQTLLNHLGTARPERGDYQNSKSFIEHTY